MTSSLLAPYQKKGLKKYDLKHMLRKVEDEQQSSPFPKSARFIFVIRTIKERIQAIEEMERTGAGNQPKPVQKTKKNIPTAEKVQRLTDLFIKQEGELRTLRETNEALIARNIELEKLLEDALSPKK